MQEKLFELVGESGFELMFSVLQDAERYRLIKLSMLTSGQGKQSTSTQSSRSSSMPSIEDFESLSLNQRRKREKKEKERVGREVEVLNAARGDPSMAWLLDAGFSEEYLEQERMLGLHGGSYASASAMSENLDHWMDNLAEAGTLEYHEKKGTNIYHF